MKPELSYLLPLRWTDDAELDELTAYLRSIAPLAELIIVDGSPEPQYRRHAEAWGEIATHLTPDLDLVAPMAKVAGVITGIRRAGHERVVIADDDIRYDPESLRRTATLLDEADLVRPQNYFRPLPWHARLDTARTLINRSFGRDFPGTLAVRRSAFERAGGYDGDVIFENLELIRTIEAMGGRVISPLDLYVKRLPPSATHFLSQRVRQAYDDLALPARMAPALAVAPSTVVAIQRGRSRAIAGVAALAIGLAELGRRRGGGARIFPASSSLLAPVWVAERAVCSWIALANRVVRGGVPYAGGVVPRSASSKRDLRHRLCESRSAYESRRKTASVASGRNGRGRQSDDGARSRVRLDQRVENRPG